MTATQSIRDMNLRAADLDSEHLFELTEPSDNLESNSTNSREALPEIVVTSGDIDSSLDRLSDQHDEVSSRKIPQLDLPPMLRYESALHCRDGVSTESIGKSGDDNEDSGRATLDLLADSDLNANDRESEIEHQQLASVEVSCSNKPSNRAMDEELLDHLLGEITASFESLELNDEQNRFSETSSRKQESSSKTEFSESIEDPVVASGEGGNVTDLSHERVDAATAVEHPTEKPAEDLRSGMATNIVHELHKEPIPTATGSIALNGFRRASIVRDFRESVSVDVVLDDDSASGVQEELDYIENPDRRAFDGVKIEAATSTVEYADVKLVDESLDELSIVSRDDAEGAAKVDPPSRLISEIANQNLAAFQTDSHETIRPNRSKTSEPGRRELAGEQKAIVDALCERTPALSAPFLMFNAADDRPSTPRCIEQIAHEFSRRPNIRRVLLVDGRTHTRLLSRDIANEEAPGLAEALLEDGDWSTHVKATSSEKLDFLPAGNGLLSLCQPIEDRLKNLSTEWKGTYDYVLIDGGEPNDVIPRLWCSMCDATYLLVTLGETETVAAKAAVTELRAYGARLLGCVVCAPPVD